MFDGLRQSSRYRGVKRSAQRPACQRDRRQAIGGIGVHACPCVDGARLTPCVSAPPRMARGHRVIRQEKGPAEAGPSKQFSDYRVLITEYRLIDFVAFRLRANVRRRDYARYSISSLVKASSGSTKYSISRSSSSSSGVGGGGGGSSGGIRTCR